jgi:hypothetical protein
MENDFTILAAEPQPTAFAGKMESGLSPCRTIISSRRFRG